MTCRASHTKLQIPDEDWACPLCGSGFDHFYIEEPDSDADESCTLLHNDDVVYCHRCNEGWSGKQYAAKIGKLKKGLITVQVRQDQHESLVQLLGSQKSADKKVQELIDSYINRKLE